MDNEDVQQGGYFYDSDCERVYITDWQAEQIYRQKESDYMAQDLKNEIDEKYSYNPYLSKLTVNDLRQYVSAIQDQFEIYNDNSALWAACRDVIEDIILPAQKRKVEGGNNI